MNLANKISVLRILLVPIFVACIVYYEPEREFLRVFALGIFILAVLTDALDGYIARTRKQKTELGTILDPIADKLLLVSAFICLSVAYKLPLGLRLPPWVPIIIISRDAIIILGALIIQFTTGHLEVVPSVLGKMATFFQMSTVISVLLRWPFSHLVWTSAVIFTVLSGVGYIRRGSRLLNSKAG